MRILPSSYTEKTALPLKLKISFKAIFEYLETISDQPTHVLHSSAKQLLTEFKNYPILKEGFEDFDYLQKYHAEINKLLDILFPDLLQSNEIKAATIPFEFTTFKLSKRFNQILSDAGENYEFKVRNYDSSKLYIMACTFILTFYYKARIDFNRPLYFDIPDQEKGILKYYRALFNGDFFTVKPLESAPEITQDDIKLLLDNFNNIDLWKEKFPPNSYQFEGFGILNLFDVTPDESISKLKENLLKKDENSFEELAESMRDFFGSNSVKFGFSNFVINSNTVFFRNFKNENSFINKNQSKTSCEGFFCDGIISKVFKNNELLAISDVEKYGKATNKNGVYQVLNGQGIQSFILVPLKLNNDMMLVMEFVSTKKYELNSLVAHKLEDIITVFKIAAKRYLEEFDTKLESVIQENYTSIHPTVKWKFYEEAENYLSEVEKGTKTIQLNDIIFENVVPLYGQSDIKSSSLARNNAIQTDLVKQLNLASIVIEKATSLFPLPIYNDLQFRINDCLKTIKSGLNSSNEVMLIDFLKRDIYPVFNHLKTLDNRLKVEVENYMSHIDEKLQVIYDRRKDYDQSVNTLNEKLAYYIDLKEVEAQEMFPHYFERYKTDGIDYNMYIGQSLVNNKTYNKLYLYNLRLWQLQLMCELENIAFKLKDELKYKLEVASLILVHSNPLAIKFRMDEKRFDVDGAYNIRYEIIKKRIDKALIKNTDERLTQPGKIAIVYSQNKDAQEYLKYIKYLQSKKYLLKEIEKVDLEDLQGITGLKALRVAVNYDNSSKNISLKEIMNVINENYSN
jgi:hypothetical protein